VLSRGRAGGLLLGGPARCAQGAPADGERALVYGCGTLDLLTIAILRATYSQAEVVAVAHHGFHADLARVMGAHTVLRSGSAEDRVFDFATGSAP